VRKIVALVLLVAAAVAIAVVLLTAGSASARDRIVGAALAQKSVHYTRTVDEDMGGAFTSVADVNADSGTALKTFVVGAVKIRLVNDTVYVHGDVQGLVTALGLTLPQAERYAGQWISIPKDDRFYAQTADGLTLASIVHDFAPRAGQKLVNQKSRGTRLVAFRGVTPDGGSEHLSARASGKPLPAYFTQSSGPASWTSGHFSKWNEPVTVTAPASSTPIASVRAFSRPRTPQGALASIVAAARAQKSVHVSETEFADLIGPSYHVVDVGRHSAVEWEALPFGGKAEIRLVDGTVYVRANTLALENDDVALTPRQAKHYAGRWISIPRTGEERRLYEHLTSGLTIASIVDLATPRSGLTTFERGLRGKPVIVVRGTEAPWGEPGGAELQAREIGPPLPVTFSWWVHVDSTSVRFSKWNEPVHVHAPAKATPIAIVRR
jgi:hypothetical protein